MEYIASSQPKYITFTGRKPKQNHVDFYKAPIDYEEAEFDIIIYNADDLSELTRLRGRMGADESSTQFNTRGDKDNVLISLSECLKKNHLFANVKLETSPDGREVAMVSADMDSENRYMLEKTGRPWIGIGGIQAWKNTRNKVVLNYDQDGSIFSQEKTFIGGDVKFDIASPFYAMTFKYPKQVKISAVEKTNGKYSLLTLPEKEYTVMPTTLPLFDNIDWDEYRYTGNLRAKNFLTRRLKRYYNYGEVCAISFLSDTPYRLRARYYTNAGVMLYDGYPEQYADQSPARTDYYFNLGLEDVERLTGNDVGFVEVNIEDWSEHIVTARPLTYEVETRCRENLEMIFVNAIGGLDSFNDWNRIEESGEVGDLRIYFTNSMKDNTMLEGNDVAEYEKVHSKKDATKYTLSTVKQKTEDAKWLKELAMSKYVFTPLTDWAGDKTIYQQIIIDSMPISTNSTESDYEISVEFHTFGREMRF